MSQWLLSHVRHQKQKRRNTCHQRRVHFWQHGLCPLPSASFVLGRTEEKQQEPVTSTSLVFGKKVDTEEPKCQPVFSFGNSEQTKDEGSSKSTFSFSTAKPSEKESEQPAKATFAFGAQTSTTADQGAAKPVFSFLNNNSSNSSTPATSAGGGIFGSSTTSSSAPVAAFVFGQASNPVSSSAFGNSAESSTSQSLLFSQESKPATTSSTVQLSPHLSLVLDPAVIILQPLVSPLALQPHQALQDPPLSLALDLQHHLPVQRLVLTRPQHLVKVKVPASLIPQALDL